MKKKFNLKKLLPVYFTLMALLFVTISCNSPKKEEQPTFDLVAAKAAIEVENKVFMDAISKGDSITAANCYTSDAKLMPPNEKAVSGRSAIQTTLAGYMKGGFTNISLKPIEVWGNENALTVEEEWFFTDKDGKELDRGKALEVWKMEDGKWKLFRDCFNSDLPIPSPK